MFSCQAQAPKRLRLLCLPGMCNWVCIHLWGFGDICEECEAGLSNQGSMVYCALLSVLFYVESRSKYFMCQAISEFENVLRLFPNHPHVLGCCGDAYLQESCLCVSGRFLYDFLLRNRSQNSNYSCNLGKVSAQPNLFTVAQYVSDRSTQNWFTSLLNCT